MKDCERCGTPYETRNTAPCIVPGALWSSYHVFDGTTEHDAQRERFEGATA